MKFGRHGGSPDEEEVDTGLKDGLVVLLRAVRAQGPGYRHPGGTNLAEPQLDEVGVDRRAVDLLHALRRVVGSQRGDLRQVRRRVLVSGPEALKVENPEPAELPQRDRRRRGHDGVHGRRDDRNLKLEGVDLPAKADLLGVAGAPGRNDRDVVKGVGPAASLAASNLDLRAHGPSLAARLPPLSAEGARVGP